MNMVQAQVELKGMEIFRLMPKEKVRIIYRRWWSGKLMELAMEDPALKVRLFHFIDALPTLITPELAAEHVREYLLSGDVRLPSTIEKVLSRSIRGVATPLAVAAIRKNIEMVARTFILEESPEKAIPVLRNIRDLGRSFTIDLLGEAALSEKEAQRHAEGYAALLDLLGREVSGWPAEGERERLFPRANVSVKISSLYSRLGPMNYEDSVAQVKVRLRPIFRRAKEIGAFVNLDMESHQIKNITLDVFMELLDEPEFEGWQDAGIVIQAYLKESGEDLRRLGLWAGERRRRVTVRLVKGAYWEYEQVTARQKGWPVPVFSKKEHTDWHFESCVDYLFNNCRYFIPAIATHNVRSIAYAMVSAERRRIPNDQYEFQMLYGMGEPIKEALRRMGFPVREYVPTGTLIPGMAYLVRRLLENTSNEGFLRKTFVEKISPAALLRAPEPYDPDLEERPRQPSAAFRNEPILDLSVQDNRLAFRTAIQQVRRDLGRTVPLVIGGKGHETEHVIASENPAQPEEVVGRACGLTADLVPLAVETAVAAQRDWGKRPPAERAAVLFRAAAVARKRKLELAAWQVLETGKNWMEADADVAEAIDYFEYYGREMLRLGDPRRLGDLPGETNLYLYRPRGIAVVIAPWNFPLAISAGMAAAALVAGNTVLYKPSSLSIMNGWQLHLIFEEAGLPPGVFNFVPGKGEVAGSALVEHPHVHLVAFTGSREVGLQIMEKASRVSAGQLHAKRVVAEMGGKNAIIVDADADLDQAVAGVIQSAFGYQGQKCSACSRVIVLAPSYQRFLDRLAEAVEGIAVGPTEDPASFMGPLIEPRAVDRLHRYLRMASEGGLIAAVGKVPAGKGYFFPPVLVTDLPRSSPILREEIFGPLLAVVKGETLDEALAIANETEYALTGGLYSRSPRSIETVAARFDVGNLYINRPITGAMVGRQPFGGFRMSGIGSKAGGPDYLLQFMEPQTITENTMRRGFTPDMIA